MALSTSSSDDSLELFDPPAYSPVPIDAPILRYPQTVCAFPGSKIFFDVCFDVSYTQTLYTVWRVGKHIITKPNLYFNILCKNGVFVLIINRVQLSMDGVVECQLFQKMPHRSEMLQSVRSFCHVLRFNETMAMFVDYDNFFQGHLQGLPVISTGIYGHSAELSGSHGRVIPRCQIYTEVQRAGPSSHQCGEHTMLYIAFARFGDDTYYVNTTFNKVVLSEITVHLDRKTAGQKDELRLEWAAPRCDCRYVIEREVRPNIYICMNITSTNFVNILAPVESDLITMRIRNITEQAPETYTSSNIEEEGPKSNPYLVCMPIGLYKGFFRHTSKIISSSENGTVRVLYERQKPNLVVGKFLDVRHDPLYKMADQLNILKALNHKNIVPMTNAFRAPGTLILVEEYLWGGSLASLLAENKVLGEDVIAIYVNQLLEGLKHLHGQYIVHLNITPKNILFATKNSHVLKITDFRKARFVPPGSDIRPTLCGPIYYIAPEVLAHEPCSVAADMWSVGVITYLLMSGDFPFKKNKNIFELISQILNGKFTFNELEIERISEEGKLFVSQLLVVNSAQRLTAEQGLKLPWVIEGPPRVEERREGLIPRSYYKILTTYSSVLSYHLRNLGRKIYRFFVGEEDDIDVV